MPNEHLYLPRTNAELLQKLIEDQGFPSMDELLEEFALEGVVPGICTICATVHDSCEPDAEENYCEECTNNKVKSCLILAEVI